MVHVPHCTLAILHYPPPVQVHIMYLYPIQIFTCHHILCVTLPPLPSVPPTVEAVRERIVGIEQMSVTVAFVILDASPDVQERNVRWTFTDVKGNSFNIPTGSLVTSFSNLTGVLSNDRLNLTLSGLNNAFEGTYTLVASNKAGSDFSVVTLVIKGQ